MKRLLIILLTVHCSLLTLFSQAPQKFNYQAVVRDDAGSIVKDQNVSIKISILQGVVDGTVVYSETHSPTTNGYGLVTLEIGGGTIVSGDLSTIDWGVDTYFLKVEMDPTGGTSYSEIGTSQLLSVPYALNAESVNELKKLGIVGDENAPLDSALFEVKRSDGQTVFAVYNEGVRVYVDDSNPKGTKGGFAIGGFNPAIKGITNEYLRVTPDSVRVYVNDDGTKGTKGGFAIGGFNPALKGITNEYLRVSPDSVRVYVEEETVKGTKGGFAIGGISSMKGPDQEFLRVTQDSVRIYINDEAKKGTKGGFAIGGFSSLKGLTGDYLNVSGKASAEIIDPSEPRVLWYPNKEAFLVGRVLVEDPNNVGMNSFASGYEAMAKGTRSQALGFMPEALGDNSTAIGNYAVAAGNESYAIGNYATTTKEGSYAIGSGASATGLYSYAVGSVGVDSSGVSTGATQASGDWAYAFGMGSVASKRGAFAFGTENNASGYYSQAMGYKSSATDWYSTTMGYENTASGNSSTAMGSYTSASGYASTTMGSITHASGDYETAMGFANDWDLTGNRIFSIGNGYFNMGPPVMLMRSDAFAVYKNGSAKIQSYLSIGNSGPITENWWEFGVDNGGGTGIDFHSNDGATDFSARIYRHPGNNNAFEITNVGGGDLILTSLGGGDINLNASGNVGIGSSNPNYKLEVGGSLAIVSKANLILQDNTGGQDPGDIIFNAGIGGQYARIYAGVYELILTTQTNNAPNLRIDNEGWVVLNHGLNVYGPILQNGSPLHPDYVFENAYELETIEEHSDYMWANKHLPAVPKAVTDEDGNNVIELGAINMGILEELEKAHIYIDQLNSAFKDQQKLIEELKQEIKKLKNR